MYVHPIPLQHIVLTIIFSASKLQNFQSSGRDKFAPLLGPLAPFVIPAWCTALQAVDRSPSLLVEVSKLSKHFGHYVFPDPGLFISPASDEKKARCIESWLRARNAWLLRAGDEPSLAMSAQNWRDLLAIDISGAQEMGDTKAAKRRQQLLDMLLPRSTFPEVKIRSSFGEPLVWQGKRYLPGVLPPENIVREILWELYELNFTFELLSLDARACINFDATNYSQRIERQAIISKCFARPVDTFKYIRIPSCNSGLAGADLEERIYHVLPLVRIMQSWKGDKPAIFSLSTQSPSEISQSHAKELEEAAAKYYCQQFFNYFGRAAQVPHRLFPIKVNLARFS